MMLTKTLIVFAAAICLFFMPVVTPTMLRQQSEDQADQARKTQLPFPMEGDHIVVRLQFDFAGGSIRKLYHPEVRQIAGSDYLVGKNETKTETQYVKYDHISMITVPASVDKQDAKSPELGQVIELRDAYLSESRKHSLLRRVVDSRKASVRQLDTQLHETEDEELARMCLEKKKLLEEELAIHEAALVKANKTVNRARYEYWVERHDAVINGRYDISMDGRR